MEKLRSSIINATENHLKCTNEMLITPWINCEIINLIEKQRMYKNASNEEGTSEYKKYI